MTEVNEIRPALSEARSRLRYFQVLLDQHEMNPNDNDPHAIDRYDRVERKLRDAVLTAESDVDLLSRELARAQGESAEAL
jgi:hypothetical protein